MKKSDKILIVGLGLIGGSYAEGLTLKGYEVYAIDTNIESIEFAKEKKIIKDGTTNVSKEFLEQMDIVIFALYPHIVIEWIKSYQKYLKPNTIITDVTGIKKWLYDNIKDILREDLEYIGAHPMAGREVYGVKNSNKDIFKGANYIITPTSSNTEYAINIAKKIGDELEFKYIVTLSIEEHDEMIGFLSQLTHCIAISLMTCKDSQHLVKYTGDSFRDLTRIARINENMWSELFLLNKQELLKQMDLFLTQFNKLKQTIEQEDIDQMKEMMKTSTLRRSYFDKKNR